MDDDELLAEQFEQHRTHLHAVSYRMLGSLAEADDAVQETWLRLSRTDTADIENLGGWLTTVTARVCLNVLRARRTRAEEPLDEPYVLDPVIAGVDAVADPEREALLADAVGRAMLVVLETLSPPERLAFVLHDMFAVPFEQIAPMVERTPAAARQLASRARRRVQSSAPPAPDLARQRTAVDAFLAASRDGDFDGLVAALHPDAVLRVDVGQTGIGRSREVRGAEAIAKQSQMFSRLQMARRIARVNGGFGVVNYRDGKPFSVLGFTVAGDRIVALDILADPERLARVDFNALEPG